MQIVRLVLAVIVSAVAMVAALPIIVIGLPFWLVATLTRALVPFCQPAIVRWPDLFEFHPRLGWKSKSNFNGYCLEEREDVFQVSTGSDGWAGSKTVSDSEVVVFGDSFAFGYSVDTRNAFFEICGEVPIKSIGAPGYNMVQEVLLMEELASCIKGKLVIWFIYLGNDLYDNLAPEMKGYRTPVVIEENDGWRIVTSHLNPSRWSCSIGIEDKRRYARTMEKLFRKNFLSRRAYSACEFLIERGRNICSQAGADLVLMTVPLRILLEPSASLDGKNIDQAYPDRQLRDTCEKLGVPIVSLRGVLSASDYRRWDDHWNELGHRKVAREIARIYRERTQTWKERQETMAATL